MKRYIRAAIADIGDEPEVIQLGVIRKPDVSEFTLEDLVNSPYSRVRADVANHPKANAEILSKLAEDSDIGVRVRVARNKHTSDETLEKLVRDSSCVVREALVIHQFHRLSKDDIEMLAEDEDTSVSQGTIMCISDPDILADLAESESGDVRYQVANNEHVTPEVLHMLSMDSDVYVRIAVSGNDNTSSEDLARLSDERSYVIRERVARNKNTSIETLEKLVSDENRKVSDEAECRLNGVR